MKDTVISTDAGPMNILEYIRARLGSSYVGCGEVIECSDYGVPQLRRRLITIFSRDEAAIKYFNSNGGSFLQGNERRYRISIMDAIGHVPAIDALDGKNAATDFHPLHYVNVMSAEKYWWVSNTPEGDTAFNNQCVNPACLYDKNARHFDFVENGKWIATKTIPIYCDKCGSLLPRPTVMDRESGERRLIKGFHSAYRRMRGDQPARALTRNFPFEASDNKIHPTQNRVLSVYEALVLQTITEYEYCWDIGGKYVPRSLMAQVIGESVPPLLIDKIWSTIMAISTEALVPSQISLSDSVFAMRS
jgi:DNA (cytosine-5)-methyltransferase 1